MKRISSARARAVGDARHWPACLHALPEPGRLRQPRGQRASRDGGNPWKADALGDGRSSAGNCNFQLCRDDRLHCGLGRRRVVVPSHHLLRHADQRPDYGLWIDGSAGARGENIRMRYSRRDPHDDPPRRRPRSPAPRRVMTLAELQRTPGGWGWVYCEGQTSSTGWASMAINQMTPAPACPQRSEATSASDCLDRSPGAACRAPRTHRDHDAPGPDYAALLPPSPARSLEMTVDLAAAMAFNRRQTFVRWPSVHAFVIKIVKLNRS